MSFCFLPRRWFVGVVDGDLLILMFVCCIGVDMEEAEEDWEEDPARGFLREFDREMEERRG